MILRRAPRVLSPAAVNQSALDRLLARHAVSGVFVAAHVARIRAARGRRQPPVIGVVDSSGELVGACWAGTNVVPVVLDQTGTDLVADVLARGGPRFASFFGPADPVLGLWERLRDTWPEPFDVRPVQPLLVMDRDPAPELFTGPARDVRWAQDEDFPRVLPAAAAMFTEEVGYSPFTTGAEGYRQRVRSLVRDRRTAVLTDEHGTVIFKADIGSLHGSVCQIQGVWVDPEHRGRGLAVPCMAATVALARQYVPTVSLYVNSFNAPALATYRRVGFRRHGDFATVLL
ncbi:MULTISPECIES: GNAT family N-acetyltransferase [Kocuria]|uniref:GNAT family N-acetyltransferase n=1 Tax=Kocuria TaxID=57493 RepID=UPI0007EB23B9|nr:GNAT family N-acetyltransferase [Kocuria sp.]MBN6812040.1 GNAT family N-acetyltransferase [Kocuria indica]MBN6843734.1 GNAT family N-acetyltransferase [Kocuria indica]OBA48895.1 GNAT family N-acetyltransferase [Kocuria sp. ICS0012]